MTHSGSVLIWLDWNSRQRWEYPFTNKAGVCQVLSLSIGWPFIEPSPCAANFHSTLWEAAAVSIPSVRTTVPRHLQWRVALTSTDELPRHPFRAHSSNLTLFRIPIPGHSRLATSVPLPTRPSFPGSQHNHRPHTRRIHSKMTEILDGDEEQRPSPGAYSSLVRHAHNLCRAHCSFPRLQPNLVSIFHPVLDIAPDCPVPASIRPYKFASHQGVVHFLPRLAP